MMNFIMKPMKSPQITQYEMVYILASAMWNSERMMGGGHTWTVPRTAQFRFFSRF